jgi:hypothetical protein
VRRLTGQAALGCAMLLHWLATVAMTAGIVVGVGLGAIAWRLSQAPVDLPWLTSRLENLVNANGGPTRLSLGSVALAWEGFRRGVDSPVQLRLTGLAIADTTGTSRMRIPQVDVSLSIYQLLFGRIALRSVALDSPQLRLLRAADGTISFDLGSLAETTDTGEPPQTTQTEPLADLLTVLAQRPDSDREHGPGSLFSQLRAVHIHDAHVTVLDRQLGATWRAPHAEIDFDRRSSGALEGTAELTLALGQQQAQLTAVATLAAGAADTHLRARLSGIMPSELASAAPRLGALAAIDAPVTTEASFDLDRNLAVREGRLSLQAGAGTVHIQQSSVAILDAAFVVSGTPDAIAIDAARVSLRGHPAAPITHIEAHGDVQRGADQLSATLSLALDQVDFADLPQLWPRGVGGDARNWIVENITAGAARNGHVDLGLAAEADLSSIELTRAQGALDGDGLQVHWLRPIPPVENGKAQLRILDPDTLEIVVAGGRQDLKNQRGLVPSGLQIRGGRMRITGIMQPHQISAIEADINGPIPDALTLLREPRLALLDRHPMDLKNPAGQMTAKLFLGVPLEQKVTMDAISIRAQAHLEGVHLSGVAAGRDLDQGVLDLDANGEGMKLAGQVLLASIPARLDAAMDFRAGPPSQVVQSVTVSGEPDTSQLAAAGLDATSFVAGPVPLQGVLTERRNGQGDFAVTADLTAAELTVAPLGWRKASNIAANASGRLTLDHDRLTGIDAVQLDGDNLTLRGRADVQDGRIARVRIDRLTLGRTVAQGTIALPTSGTRRPIVANVAGPTVDLTARLARRAPTTKPPPNAQEPPPGPPWTVDARFDRVLMAHDQVLTDVAFHAEDNGRLIQQLQIDGRTGSRAPFQVQIAPAARGRRFTASTSDAGDLLNGLDLVRVMQGGALSLDGQSEDAQPGRPLNGTITIENFRIRNAPALAKLLQAMTLYGLVEVVQGPGLGFTRLVAPFRLTDDTLELSEARAFSPSLGLTAKGRIDLNSQRADMQGTIVPAYFFNSLLGNIPLVGKLFSPERGGGVFAASYTLRGPVEDPTVSINPLTALTPGFLRGLFGGF